MRLLGHPVTSLPDIGSLESVIAVGERELTDTLRGKYPSANHHYWGPVVSEDFARHFESQLIAANVIRANFGTRQPGKIARKAKSA